MIVIDGGSALKVHLLSEVVWTTTKQIGLIDSIMHNYHVPPLVFGGLRRCVVLL